MQINEVLLSRLFEEDQYYYIIKHNKEIVSNINWNFMSMIKTSERIIDYFFDKLNISLVLMSNQLSESWLLSKLSVFSIDNINNMCRYQVLSKTFITNNAAVLNWEYIIKYQKDLCSPTDMTFVNDNILYIDKNLLIKYHKVSEQFLTDNYVALNKLYISRYQIISDSFISLHYDDLDFNAMLLSGSINTQLQFETYEVKLNLNIAIEFIQFDIAFLENKYSLINKRRLWRYQKNYTTQFLQLHIADITENDWFVISKFAILTEELLTNFYQYLNKRMMSKYQQLPLSFIELHIDELDKRFISKYQVLSEPLMIRIYPKLDINYLIMYQSNLTLNTILTTSIIKTCNVNLIYMYKTVDMTFINTYLSKIDYYLLSQHFNLPESFILDNIYKLDRNNISYNQVLSNVFISTNIDKLNTHLISKKQILAESLIDTIKDKLNIDYIIKYQTLTPVFKTNLIAWFNSSVL